MDPMMIAALISAGGQGLNLLSASNARDDEERQFEQNLAFQKKMYEDQLKAAKEGRSDVYGNKLVYKPGIGWTYELTPQTAQITSGEQTAQLRNQELARQGAGDYESARAKYLYGPRESQEGLTDELTRLQLINRRKGLDEGGSILARQALRMNMGNQIPKLIREADKRFGESLEESILRGRQLGREEYRTGEQFRTQQGGADLTRFLNQATGGGSSGLGSSLGAMGQNANTALLRALGDTGGLSSVYSQAAGGYKPLDFSGLANSLGKLWIAANPEEDESSYPKSQARLYPSGGVA